MADGALNNIARPFEQRMDQALNAVLFQSLDQLSQALVPVAMAGVTLYMVILGYQIMRNQPIREVAYGLIGKIMVIAIFAAIALNPGDFRQFVYDADAGTGVLYGIQAGVLSVFGQGENSSVFDALDNLSSWYGPLQGRLLDKAGEYDWVSTDIFNKMLILTCVLVLVLAQLVLMLLGIGWAMIAKVGLALVMSLGPAFILCAVFPATQPYAWRWLGQALHFIFLHILLVAVIGFAAGVAQVFFTSVPLYIEPVNIFLRCLTLCLVSGVIAVVMFNVPRMSSMLVGGFEMQGIMGKLVGLANKALNKV